MNWRKTLYVKTGGHWIQIRGLSSKDRTSLSISPPVAARLDVNNSWWSKHRLTFGNQKYIIRNYIKGFLIFIIIIILFYILIWTHKCKFKYIYFCDAISRLIPEICSVYFWYKMPKHISAVSDRYDPFHNSLASICLLYGIK